MFKKKLPRLYKSEDYVTGNNNKWTYEYTWEDFEIARKMFPVTIAWNFNSLQGKIYNYFRDHPEKLLEGGICKERNYSLEKIRNIFEGRSIEIFNLM
jgi:hypothetical protein